MWGLYEYLRPAQIEAICSQTPIVYIPWGALEWHSYQNPIGLDGLKAHGLCKAMAAQTGGIVLPPVYVGTDTIKPLKGFKHTLEHQEDTVRVLCYQFLEQLADEGFKVIVVLTGHYGRAHVNALKETCAEFTDQRSDIKVWMMADWEPVEGVFEGNHAAKGETSYQMYYHPDTVDLTLLPDDRQTTLDDDGVAGLDPRESSAAHGEEQEKAFLQKTVPIILEMLNE